MIFCFLPELEKLAQVEFGPEKSGEVVPNSLEIKRFISLIYENIAKMANKIFNVPNHLKHVLICISTYIVYLYLCKQM